MFYLFFGIFITLILIISADEDAQLIPQGMSNDCVAQTWYRFLRTIGNPIALCSPHIISKSSHFVQWALTHDKGAETYQHPCLQALPLIFLKAIKGISNQVDAFLGKLFLLSQKGFSWQAIEIYLCIGVSLL